MKMERRNVRIYQYKSLWHVHGRMCRIVVQLSTHDDDSNKKNETDIR